MVMPGPPLPAKLHIGKEKTRTAAIITLRKTLMNILIPPFYPPVLEQSVIFL
jgi:hypothetical protein